MKEVRRNLGLSAGVVLLFACSGFMLACSDDDDDPSPGSVATEAATTVQDATGATGVTSATGGATGATGPKGTTSATGATGAASERDEEVEAFTRDFIDAYNSQDAEAFFGMMTDEAVAEFLELFGVDTTDLNAAREEAAPFIGEDPIEIEELTVTESSVSSATVEMIGSSSGILEGDRLELTREGEEWKVASLQLYAVSPDVPDGYTTIGMDLQEFAFLPDGRMETGNIAFALENRGQQAHEAILAKLDKDLDRSLQSSGYGIDEALRSESEDGPEGAEVIAGVFGLEPGQSYNMVLTEELEPGRYAFVCFFPDTTDPEQTPHAFKGMGLEFNIE